ncbi:MAG: sensor domain-containing protein, partial [Mycobacterium sp.]
SVLAATVSIGWASPNSDSTSIPEGRAIGVRGNCLVEVEVEVDFFNTSNPSHYESGDINTSAVDIAQAMMDRVSALS